MTALLRLGDAVEILPSASTSSAGEVRLDTVTSGCLTPIGFNPAGIRPNRMSVDAARASLINSGEVLVSRSNTEDLVGRAATYPGHHAELHASDLVFRIRPGDAIDADYLGYYLAELQLRGYWRGRSNGASSTMKKITRAQIGNLLVPALSVRDQRRISGRIRSQFLQVRKMIDAMAMIEAAADGLIEAAIRESYAAPGVRSVSLSDVIQPVSKQVGARWRDYPLLGASTQGLMPAKEPPGQRPETYRLVTAGTIFYNPMRILIGSIAYVANEPGGIVTPDYVAFRTDAKALDETWFYWWLKSWRGKGLIKSLARGAVRERILFPRLRTGVIGLPPVAAQRAAADAIRAAAKLRERTRQWSADASALPRVLLSRELKGASSAAITSNPVGPIAT